MNNIFNLSVPTNATYDHKHSCFYKPAKSSKWVMMCRRKLGVSSAHEPLSTSKAVPPGHPRGLLGGWRLACGVSKLDWHIFGVIVQGLLGLRFRALV